MLLLKRLKSRKLKYEYVLIEWLNSKNNIKKSSYNKYLYNIEKYINPYLGKHKFRKIKQKEIKSFFNNKKIRTLNNSTKNSILTVINSSMKYGVQKKYRKKFKTIDLKFKKEKNEITYFTIKEQELIEKYIRRKMDRRKLLILVALYSGARIGELCALKGTDIDFINNTITINKTVSRISNKEDGRKTKLVVGIPKTKNSIRTIPISQYVIKQIKRKIEDENNYIFTNTNKPKDPRSAEKYFNTVLKKVNIKQLNFHSLRHTYATRLREQNVDIKVISNLLGHADWKITQEIYVHATLDSIKKSVEGLDTLYEKEL